jgi:hypothetical protein
MPSAQDCAERLREQAYRTLLPQIRDLEQELHTFNNSLSSGFHQLGQRLDALSHIELPTTEPVLNEILGDVIRETDNRASDLLLFAHTLRQKETQEEILSLLLDGAHKYFPRTALFAVRGSRFVGWSSRGYPGGLEDTIRSCTFLRSEAAKLEEVLNTEGPVTIAGFQECAPLDFLNGKSRGVHCLIPLRVLQRPVALLLAEGLEDSPNDRNVLSILAEFATLRLENIALRILYQLTASKPEFEFPVQAETAVPSAPSIAAEPAATPAHPAIALAGPREEPEHVLESRSDPELEESVQTPLPEAEMAAEAEQGQIDIPGSHAEIEAQASEPEPLKVQAQEPQPAQDTRPLPEEEKLHSDAKRFARLLVSEIKLYNEHHVVGGRENRDLYLRLKRDIDRSREMYEKRVSPQVSRKIDYFHDEIIRILGDNDPSTLGSDYPGPRVES